MANGPRNPAQPRSDYGRQPLTLTDLRDAFVQAKWVANRMLDLEAELGLSKRAALAQAKAEYQFARE